MSGSRSREFNSARRQAKEALETLAPVKSVTPADAHRLFELLAFAKMENGDMTAARADATRWLSNAKDPDDRERANRFIESLDGAARTDDGTATRFRGDFSRHA